MRWLSYIAILVCFGGCAPRSETVLYWYINPGDELRATIVGTGADSSFQINALADGESETQKLYPEAGLKSATATQPVIIELDDLSGKFVEIKLTARGKGARWENVKIISAPAGARHVSRQQPACPSSGCNVVIYVIDALRADRLGCYGYGNDTSPYLDAFARRSIMYSRAYAPSSWTRASVASLFTGAYPQITGAVTRNDHLRKDIPTLAESFKQAGYYTVGYTSNGNIAPELGFGRGFDEYLYIPENPERASIYPSSQEMLDVVLPKLSEVQEPFFAYIHTLDPHAPYTPPAKFAKRFIPPEAVSTPGDMGTLIKFIWRNPPATEGQVAYLSGLYDGEVAAADAGFGRFLEWLDEQNLTGSTIVIFTSDHGEEFYDHKGLAHGGTLYEELVHVPLIIHHPGVEPGKNHDLVNLIDIMPTLLSYLDIPIPKTIQGHFLRLLPVGARRAVPLQPIYCYEKLDKVDKESIILWPFKLIHNINRRNQWGETVAEYEFYNLEEDPGEQVGIFRKNKIAKKVLLEALREINQKNKNLLPPGTSSPIPIDLKKRLEAIGY